MHEKRAKDKQKNLLEQEKQLYQARIRSQIRSTLSPSSSSSSSTHNPISPHQHIKALADRFMKDGAQDLWNHSDGPLTPIEAQPQIEAQSSPQIDLRKLTHQSSNQNLHNFSQIRGFRSVPDVRDSSDRKCDSSDRKPVGTEKKRIWRKNDSSSDSESEDEVESQNQGYYSNVGSIASLGKHDAKRERRVMPKKFDDGTDFSEQVQLIKYEIHKKKLNQNGNNQGEEQENILSQTRYCSFASIEMVLYYSFCFDMLFS
jgi:ATP-dependent RNA helicase MSS116